MDGPGASSTRWGTQSFSKYRAQKKNSGEKAKSLFLKLEKEKIRYAIPL